jgi:hypothetical protein
MPCLLMIIEATYWNVCPVVEAVVVSGSTFPFSPWEKKKDHASIVFGHKKWGVVSVMETGLVDLPCAQFAFWLFHLRR